MISLRYRPLYDFHEELNHMRNQLNEVFGAERTNGQRVDSRGFPPLNACEDEDFFYVEAELPGLSLDDLEICLPDTSTVTIKGNRQQPELPNGRWHRTERPYGSFERMLALPGAVDADQVEATLKNGVLTIKLPKVPELRPRKIEIKAS